MVSQWNTSGNPVPTSTTSYSDHITDLDNGLNTSLTCDSGTTSPNSGAPTAWGAAEVGRLWFDITNEAGSGDLLGGITKRWEQTGATPTYSMRTLHLVGYHRKSPNTTLISATATSVTAWTDLDVGGATSSNFALYAELYVEVSESNPGAGIYAAFRTKGVTTDSHVQKVVPQVAGITSSGYVKVFLDATQTLQYQLLASGNTSANLNIDLLGYWERV